MNHAAKFLFIALLLWNASAMADDNAGIFFYGPPPTLETIIDLAKGATVTKTPADTLTKVAVRWPDVSVTITIDPNWNRSVQLSGIRGWLSQLPQNERTSPAVTTFLANLDRTTASYGSVISPGYDASGKVTNFLKALVARSGGFFFSHQSFYTAQGTRVTGLGGDPSTLGPK